MANTDAPHGLRPVRYRDGRPYNGASNPYYATGATGQIAIGDPVTWTGSGNTVKFGRYDQSFLQQVSLATQGDGNPILGVCVGVEPVTDDSLPYRVTSTNRVIFVADSPDLVFQVQLDDDGATSSWSETEFGLFANLASATADTTYGISQWELDGSDAPDSDYSNQVALMGLARIPGNVLGPFAEWEVMINLHQLTTGAISDAGRFEAI